MSLRGGFNWTQRTPSGSATGCSSLHTQTDICTNTLPYTSLAHAHPYRGIIIIGGKCNHNTQYCTYLGMLSRYCPRCGSSGTFWWQIQTDRSYGHKIMWLPHQHHTPHWPEKPGHTRYHHQQGQSTGDRLLCMNKSSKQLWSWTLCAHFVRFTAWRQAIDSNQWTTYCTCMQSYNKLRENC